jgi:hypothetical protein
MRPTQRDAAVDAPLRRPWGKRLGGEQPASSGLALFAVCARAACVLDGGGELKGRCRAGPLHVT